MKVRPRLFALLWLVAGLGVVPLSIVVFMAAMTGFRWVAEQLTGAPIYDYWDDNFALFAALYGVISGCCVGILQQFIVARAWRVKLTGWWRASTLGGLLGGMVVWLLIELLDYTGWLWSMNLTPTQYSTLHLSLPALLFVLCLAAAQASKLRLSAPGAGLWLAAHALAILLPTLFAYSLIEAIDPLAMRDDYIGASWFLSHFVLLTIFTLFAMRRLVSRAAWQNKTKHKNPVPFAA